MFSLKAGRRLTGFMTLIMREVCTLTVLSVIFDDGLLREWKLKQLLQSNLSQ